MSTQPEIILRQIQSLLDSLTEGPEITTVENLVEVGVVLDAIQTTVKRKMDVIRPQIRKEAVARLRNKTGTERIIGRFGSATVTVPTPSLQLMETEAVAIRRMLGDKFHVLFEEVGRIKYKLRNLDLEEIEISPTERAVLMRSLRQVEDTPQVSFKIR